MPGIPSTTPPFAVQRENSATSAVLPVLRDDQQPAAGRPPAERAATWSTAPAAVVATRRAFGRLRRPRAGDQRATTTRRPQPPPRSRASRGDDGALGRAHRSAPRAGCPGRAPRRSAWLRRRGRRRVHAWSDERYSPLFSMSSCDRVGNQVADRQTGGQPLPDHAGGDVQARDLHHLHAGVRTGAHDAGPQRSQHRGEPGQIEAGAGGGDERAQLEDAGRVLPGEDVEHGVGAGDEEQLGVRRQDAGQILEGCRRCSPRPARRSPGGRPRTADARRWPPPS